MNIIIVLYIDLIQHLGGCYGAEPRVVNHVHHYPNIRGSAGEFGYDYGTGGHQHPHQGMHQGSGWNDDFLNMLNPKDVNIIRSTWDFIQNDGDFAPKMFIR